MRNKSTFSKFIPIILVNYSAWCTILWHSLAYSKRNTFCSSALCDINPQILLILLIPWNEFELKWWYVDSYKTSDWHWHRHYWVMLRSALNVLFDIKLLTFWTLFSLKCTTLSSSQRSLSHPTFFFSALIISQKCAFNDISGFSMKSIRLFSIFKRYRKRENKKTSNEREI